MRSDPVAVAKIFALKGRPSDHPLIVHLERAGDLDRWALDIPDAARELAGHFWPGALTLILRKAPHVPMEVTGGQDSVGLRVPAGVAHRLLGAFNRLGERGGIAAPFRQPLRPREPDDGAARARRVRAGPCGARRRRLRDRPGVRPSSTSPATCRCCSARAASRARASSRSSARPWRRDTAGAPRASGTLAAHYAPRTALALVDRATVAEELKNPDVAVLALGHKPVHASVRAWIAGSNDPVRYGHDLYANLRTLDASGARRILVEAPPKAPAWEAVNDRLARAAAGADALGDEP